MIYENEVEQYLKEQVEGRLGGLCLKFVSPNCRGVPDRLLLLPGGRSCFVEVKRQQGIVNGLQHYWQDRLHALHQQATIVWSKEDVDELVQALYEGAK